MAVEYATNYELKENPVARMGFLQLAPGQGADGYGKRIHTDYMIKLAGEKLWRRVYCIQISNVGSLYIEKDGKQLFLRDGEMDEAREKYRASR